MESHYIGSFRYLLVLSIKKFTKNVLTDSTEIFLRGQFKLEPHPHWSPLGVSFEFSDENPRHVYMGVPQPHPPPPHPAPSPPYTLFQAFRYSSWDDIEKGAGTRAK